MYDVGERLNGQQCKQSRDNDKQEQREGVFMNNWEFGRGDCGKDRHMLSEK
jgi:hypothetical protein